MGASGDASAAWQAGCVIKRFVANAAALGLATWLLSGITLGADTWLDAVVTMLVVAAFFGLVNALVRPVVKFFSLPFIVLTLGAFVWVINAGMLMLTSWIAGRFGWPWHVDGWIPALLGALIVTIIGGTAGHLLEHQ